MTRLLVFEDSVFERDDEGVWTDRAFLLFAACLSRLLPQVTMLGRLDPRPGRSYYRLPDAVRFCGLPHYPSLVHPSALPAMLRSLRTAWTALGDADVAWLMGPHPLAVVMALLARLRRTPIVLGVRQDLPRYARERHPGRRVTHLIADALEAAWLRLARRAPVIAVGPDLARRYAHSPRVIELVISLAGEAEATRERVSGDAAGDGSLRVLSVGRIETEKNPLLLADVLAALRRHDERWRLVVCGVGGLEDELRARLAQLGVDDAAELLGYVPVDAGLMDVYRSADVFLHVSWTEGLPQVLYEAWAAGVPVVATAVGGVPDAAGDAAVLIPPGSAQAAVDAILRVQGDRELAEALVRAGRERAASSTFEATLDRAAAFLRAAVR
jgi:glycosyltransferase involved in cell wall biosynthesis